MASIPLSKLKEFEELYHILIEPGTNNYRDPKPVIESRLPEAFKILHSSITTILREHVPEHFRREEEEIDK